MLAPPPRHRRPRRPPPPSQMRHSCATCRGRARAPALPARRRAFLQLFMLQINKSLAVFLARRSVHRRGVHRRSRSAAASRGRGRFALDSERLEEVHDAHGSVHVRRGEPALSRPHCTPMRSARHSARNTLSRPHRMLMRSIGLTDCTQHAQLSRPHRMLMRSAGHCGSKAHRSSGTVRRCFMR
jgi:hypothetical protein